MPKSPDEKIDTLEKRLNLWRVLAILLIVLLLVVQRNRIGSWLDHAEHWMGNVAEARRHLTPSGGAAAPRRRPWFQPGTAEQHRRRDPPAYDFVMPRVCSAGSVPIGPGHPLAIIAGPCVLESLELGLTIGRAVKDLCQAHELSYIFKASFDKANRTSIDSPRGPGLERGLAWMRTIGEQLRVPLTTDIHEPAQAEPAARVVDILQIPAFLCRQTDLLVAAGRAAAAHGRGVNVKKGQFVSPDEMRGPVHKLAEAGCLNVMLTEPRHGRRLRPARERFSRRRRDDGPRPRSRRLGKWSGGGRRPGSRVLRLHALHPAAR